MSIDSFGFQVMSLDELIARLTEIRERNPRLGGHPVWTGNMPPLYFPVKSVETPNHNGVHLMFERGGN